MCCEVSFLALNLDNCAAQLYFTVILVCCVNSKPALWITVTEDENIGETICVLRCHWIEIMFVMMLLQLLNYCVSKTPVARHVHNKMQLYRFFVDFYSGWLWPYCLLLQWIKIILTDITGILLCVFTAYYLQLTLKTTCSDNITENAHIFRSLPPHTHTHQRKYTEKHISHTSCKDTRCPIWAPCSQRLQRETVLIGNSYARSIWCSIHSKHIEQTRMHAQGRGENGP